MNCPRCNNENDTAEIENPYFFGRNSAGVPFFKCAACGQVFYVDDKEGIARIASRGERGFRLVPVIWGLAQFLVAGLALYFFGSNTLTWIVAGLLGVIGISAMRIGLFGSQELIDEMTIDKETKLSKRANEELRRMSKLE
jgi:hypothetical protein